MSNDIRWRDVYATVRKYEQTVDEAMRNVRENVTEVIVEVSFDGLVLVSKHFIGDEDLPFETVSRVLDAAVRRIDDHFEYVGRPPYNIRSHA